MIVAALKVIAKVASMLLEAIKRIISTMLKPIMNPIKRSIRNYILGLDDYLTKLRESISNTILSRENNSYENELPSFYSTLTLFILGTSFPILLLGLLKMLIVLQNFITGISFVTGPAATGILRVIANKLNQIISTGIGEIINYFETVYKGFVIGLMIKWIADWIQVNIDIPVAIGTFLISFLYIFGKICDTKDTKITFKDAFLKYYKDTFGLLLSFISMIITISMNLFSPKNRIYATYLCFALALIGFGIAIFIQDLGDKTWTIPFLEEGISAAVLGVASYNIVMGKIGG